MRSLIFFLVLSHSPEPSLLSLGAAPSLPTNLRINLNCSNGTYKTSVPAFQD